MADTKTANDWKQVASNLDAQITALEKQQRDVQDQLRSQGAITNALRQKRNNLSDRNSPEGLALLAQINESERKVEQLNIQIRQISTQIVNLDAELQRAERQSGIADAAPPGTSSNPAPANPEPGNNTEVQPGTTAFELANAEPQTVPDNGLELPPGADPDEERQPGLPEPPDVDDSGGGLPLPPGADPDEERQPGLPEPPVVDEEFGDLEGAIARNQEDNEARAELERESRRTTVAANVAAARKQQEVKQSKDMRIRLHLANRANYLYRDPEIKKDDILYPLLATDGVIFPYTPTINISYNANYQATDITHSNYKYYNYVSSAVDSLQITGMFTAQDTTEASYLLAVIHFFKSVTKMFYGKDQNPIRGTPPPLLYMSGYGSYGFSENPLVVTTFNLNYPEDVDYINAGSLAGGTAGFTPYSPPVKGRSNPSNGRLAISGLQPGGAPPPPKFQQNPRTEVNTRVPTKMQLQLTCQPIVTRAQISNDFSLKDYGRGLSLIRGIW